ncbi:MAG: sigma-54-dependent Fis family transcriptional regulator [Nitrospirae bacterium]|nr:sigma-54-dependent Fis family transcriptional regulator [Nitrospirota bacterium]
MAQILIVEDDVTFRSFVRTILEDEGYDLRDASDGLKGLELLRRENFDLVISDLKMPGMGGLELFRETRSEPVPPVFIFLTAFGKVEEAVAAIKEGAADFLTKPLHEPETLRALVRKTIANITKEKDYLSLKESETAGLPPEEMIFSGAAMNDVRGLVYSVAATTANVLIHGESGTGKELIAKTIHRLSPRGKAGFVAINCAAIPENLLESELFGHEKGAFTGAVQTRIGRFEMAAGGTIFLDEIGEMPVLLQAKLLRVLQERVFERVGGGRQIKADVRVIAATNRNLQEAVADKTFREDLFYRLNVFPITLPPLRQRGDAIARLAEYFLQHFSRQIGRKPDGIAPEALAALERHHWPGNIRELQNVIERAVILARGRIGLEHLPAEVTHGESQMPEHPAGGMETLKSVEREIIVKALEKHGGNRRLAARELGMSRRTLQYRLKEFGLLDEG